jgi:uroporphyrin-III C-methyltransferase
LITKHLIVNGKSPQTPIALIHWGTLSDQRIAVGTLENIEEVVEREQITNPSMIVIGEVVTLHKKLNWFQEEIVPNIPVANR